MKSDALLLGERGRGDRDDDQHDEHRWLEGPDPAMHEYVDRYFERWDLPRT